ncbi:MAG: branched-chain amino acid ABC transporter substrate-binding protein [Anaerolineaceae bacterium]|nr:branched-chain amino acid ABC transporter substrate-binding protein [Anaerolineaceae bacterium]
MFGKRFIGRFFVLLTLAAMILTACGSSGGSAGVPTKGEVIVYVGVPLTGFQANAGQTVRDGVRLAAAEMNRQGGLLGYKVIVRSLDDQSDDQTAVDNVAKIEEAIANGEKVLGVIGHLNSGQTLAAMELYSKLPLVVITPTASEVSLTGKGYSNFFRVNANDAVQADTVAKFLVNQIKAKNVAVVFNDSPYGVGLGKAVSDDLNKMGVKVVLSLKIKEGQSEFPSEIPQIKNSAPDAVFYAGYEIDTPYLRDSLVTSGITVPMIASDGAFLSTTIDEAGDSANGLYVTSFAPSPKAVASAAWKEAYQAVTNRNPDTYSINGYTAMSVLGEAVRKTGSLEPAKVAAVLHSGAEFDTIIGTLAFQANGDLLNGAKIWVYQVKENEFSQIVWDEK